MSDRSTAGPLDGKVFVLSGFAFPSVGFNQIEGLPLIRIRDLSSATTEIRFKGKYDPLYVVSRGDVLIGMDGDFEVHRWSGDNALLNQRVCKVTSASQDIDQNFLFWYLKPKIAEIHRKTPQTTVRHLSAKDVRKIPEPPINSGEQEVVGRILDTLDTAIGETEAIIAKLQAVKQGLLHDLLTRGIDANGELRPPQAEAPDLYKQSPLGWIPKDWACTALREAALPSKSSFVDGDWIESPFITDSGIRLIQTGNIGVGTYIDKPDNRRFISEGTFKLLNCKRVYGGDILICRLADPIGRACEIPDYIGPAITSVDCTIFRCDPERVDGGFALMWLNSDANLKVAQDHAAGSTRSRISRSNMAALPFPMPCLREQLRIGEAIKSLDARLLREEQLADALCAQKAGLMDDLLTGRVRVTPLLSAEQQARIRSA